MTYKINHLKRMLRYSVIRFCPVLVILFSLIPTLVFSQTQLERISKADRSDGLGYVVRYHFSQPIDSFTVIQPAPDLIQMELFDPSIDTTGINIFDQQGKIQEVRLYDLDGSYGVDIYLDEGVYVKSNAYLDRNQRDIILALTKADEYDVQVYTQQFLANNWFLNIDPDEYVEPTETEPVVRTNANVEYNAIADRLRFDTIVIDAGHGSGDPGSIGYRNTREEDVTLAIALRLGEYIERNLPDVKVIYTRKSKDDVIPGRSIEEKLEERGRIANRAQADLFVSIHADAYHNSSVRGSSVFFLGLNRHDKSLEVMTMENQMFSNHGIIENLTEEDLMIYELANTGKIATSERIAYMVEDQLRNRARRKSRGVKQMGLVVLYQATMPGILVETGFLTNPSDQRYLTDPEGQAIIASAIFRAIRDYKEEFEKTETFTQSNR